MDRKVQKEVRAIHHVGVDPAPLLMPGAPEAWSWASCRSCFRNHCFKHKIKHATAYCLILGGYIFLRIWPNLFVAGQCPLDYDTGYPCRFLTCGDKTGITQCGSSHTCVCKPGYCSQSGFCQLNASSLLAKVVPVDNAHPVFPGAHAHVSTALCISGGGSRSLTLALGALRALENLELMPQIDAISSVSGGTWAAAVYVFANESKTKLLGNFKRPWSPSGLTLDALAEELPRLGQVATTSMYNFMNSWSIDSDKHTLWQRYVGDMILKPFNLEGRDTYMAASQEDVDRIRADNPVMRHVKFVTPQPGRPKVLVMNAALLAPVTYVSAAKNVVSFQASPDFTGSPFHPDGKQVVYDAPHTTVRSSIRRWVGGGLVETFAVGGDPPETDDLAKADEFGRVRLPAPKVPLTLQFVAGASSAAFAKMFQRFQYWGHMGVNLNPTFEVWPVPEAPEHVIDDRHNDYHMLGDGGTIENSGVLAMLQRGASRIVWLVNTDTGLSAEVPFCDLFGKNLDEIDPRGWVTNQVTDKFGYGHNSASVWLGKNQVFSKSDFLPLLCDAQKLMKAGKPTVVKKTHTVVPNSWWGIKGNTDVEVLYVFNERCRDFEELLPEDTRYQVEHGDQFKGFPFYKTTLQNFPQFTALRTEQVRLLAAQGEYAMLQNTDLLAEMLT